MITNFHTSLRIFWLRCLDCGQSSDFKDKRHLLLLKFVRNECKEQCYDLRRANMDIGAFHYSQVAKSIL